MPGRKLLRPIADTIPVHVCWNNEHGNPGRLVAVEFTDDREVCSVETDPTEGDVVEVWDDGFAIDGDYTFSFVKQVEYVGNIMWDMIWMPREDAGELAEYLQRQHHWHLQVAVPEIFDRWGDLTGKEFVEILERLSE